MPAPAFARTGYGGHLRSEAENRDPRIREDDDKGLNCETAFIL